MQLRRNSSKPPTIRTGSRSRIMRRSKWRSSSTFLRPRFGWPLIPIERQRCTMAMALALSLPAKLETVARALELRNQKDVVGHRLMLMMAKPRKARRERGSHRRLLVRGRGPSRAPIRILPSRTSKPSVSCLRDCSHCRLRNKRCGRWTQRSTSAVLR